MFTTIFAHNGVDHSNQVEAAAHQSGHLLEAVLIGVVIAVVIYGAKRLYSDRQSHNTKRKDD